MPRIGIGAGIQRVKFLANYDPNAKPPHMIITASPSSTGSCFYTTINISGKGNINPMNTGIYSQSGFRRQPSGVNHLPYHATNMSFQVV